MKKITALAFILMVTTLSIAQTTNEQHQVVGTPETIQKNNSLHDLATRVNTCYSVYVTAQTADRTSYTQAQNDLQTALDAYISALENALSSANVESQDVLNREIATAKQLIPTNKTSSKR